MKKVFVIGFNRTATKAIHNLFKKSGYMSTHYSLRDMTTGGSIIIAEQMKKNLDEYKPLLFGMDHMQVFSDMFWHRENVWIDGNKYYKRLHQEYPDAYFILNTREMEGWINSKKAHKKGAYLKRCMQHHNLDEQKMLDWFRYDRDVTEDDMITYFKNNDRFIKFDVEQDDISKLIEFVKPEFFLKENDWVRV